MDMDIPQVRWWGTAEGGEKKVARVVQQVAGAVQGRAGGVAIYCQITLTRFILQLARCSPQVLCGSMSVCVSVSVYVCPCVCAVCNPLEPDCDR